MHIQILTISGCPHAQTARDRLAAALLAVDAQQVVVHERELRADDDLLELKFAGSPTFLLDGVDLEPQTRPISELACRVYRTAHGVAGCPDTQRLTLALEGLLRPTDSRFEPEAD